MKPPLLSETFGVFILKAVLGSLFWVPVTYFFYRHGYFFPFIFTIMAAYMVCDFFALIKYTRRKPIPRWLRRFERGFNASEKDGGRTYALALGWFVSVSVSVGWVVVLFFVINRGLLWYAPPSF